MPGMAASAAESLRGRALQNADAHLCLMWVTLHHGVVGKPAECGAWIFTELILGHF